MDDLRDLTAAEAAMVARWPLPDGVPDAILNKGQLATALGTTETTLTAWKRKGMPCEDEGTNGRAWRFRLSVAYAWNKQREADEDSEREAGDAAAHQMQLALLGGQTASPVDGKMTIREQRAALELELIQQQAERGRGNLVPRDDVVLVFEDFAAAIRDALDALPDRIVRALGLEGRQADVAEKECDAVLRLANKTAEEALDAHE